VNNNHSSLKEIERRAYRSTFADGIYDIQFGLIFLAFALIAILEVIGVSSFIGYSLLLIPLIIPWLGKRYITIPRMGKVEFGEKRKRRKLIIIIVSTTILFLTLPLIIMIIKQNSSGALGLRLIAIFAAPLFVLAVYTTDFPRLYIYAVLLIAGVIMAEFLLSQIGSPLNAVISFGLPGIVITAIGIKLLFKFIRTYPRTEAEYVE
jgi:hypothetical protein